MDEYKEDDSNDDDLDGLIWDNAKDDFDLLVREYEAIQDLNNSDED